MTPDWLAEASPPHTHTHKKQNYIVITRNRMFELTPKAATRGVL